jgi:8-hydroxy-5-deazaflavin:NADPH oxidoreductase
MNYAPDRYGQLPELDSDKLTSSELVQRHLDGARVVKAFNNITTPHLAALARPSGTADRCALPIAGDDQDAKAKVSALLDDLGYDAADIGGLAESWRFGPNTPLYALVYAGEQPPTDKTISELLAWFARTPGGPVPIQQVKLLAETTTRGPAGFSLNA